MVHRCVLFRSKSLTLQTHRYAGLVQSGMHSGSRRQKSAFSRARTTADSMEEPS